MSTKKEIRKKLFFALSGRLSPETVDKIRELFEKGHRGPAKSFEIKVVQDDEEGSEDD